jgi:hypothetical protein
VEAVSLADLHSIITREENRAERVTGLMNAILDQAVRKAKNIVANISQKVTQSGVELSQSQWVKVLEDLHEVKAVLCPGQDEVNTYKIFMRKLLDGRITQSIE